MVFYIFQKGCSSFKQNFFSFFRGPGGGVLQNILKQSLMISLLFGSGSMGLIIASFTHLISEAFCLIIDNVAKFHYLEVYYIYCEIFRCSHMCTF